MTYNRLIKRRVLLLGLLFLLMTGVFAPVAFYAGKAKGAQYASDLSQNGPKTASFGDYSGQEIICGWTGKTRDAQLEAFCHPFFHARGGKKAAPVFVTAATGNETSRAVRSTSSASGATSGPGNLNDAVTAYVADLIDDPSPAGNPLALALAPDSGGAGAYSDPWSSPSPYFGGGGYPNVVVPGFIPGLPPILTPEDENPAGGSNGNNGGNNGGGNPNNPSFGDPTGSDPIISDPIVTPLPGAVVFWIPGAIALFFAMGRRKKA